MFLLKGVFLEGFFIRNDGRPSVSNFDFGYCYFGGPLFRCVGYRCVDNDPSYREDEKRAKLDTGRSLTTKQRNFLFQPSY